MFNIQNADSSQKSQREINISIDEITSGKCENGIFTFNLKRKPVMTTPVLPLREANMTYNWAHHLEMEDVEAFSKNFPAFIPHYEKRYTLNSWGELVKFGFYRLISNGMLDTTLDMGGEQVRYRFAWTGPEKSEPEIVFRANYK